MELNWKPLENRLGRDRYAGFVYMGRVNAINLYKRGISCTYLDLDIKETAMLRGGAWLLHASRFELELAELENSLTGLRASLDTP